MMRFRYFILKGGAKIAGNTLIVDTMSKSAIWNSCYTAFVGNGRTIPVTMKQVEEELEEITKHEYMRITCGYYTPARFL